MEEDQGLVLELDDVAIPEVLEDDLPPDPEGFEACEEGE